MTKHTEIWLARCNLCPCGKDVVSADQFIDGVPHRGLRLLGTMKSTQNVRRLSAGDARYGNAVSELRKMAAPGGPHAEFATELLAGLVREGAGEATTP